MSERKPLTLEELRKMYNCADRIGVHVLLCIDGVFGVEGVIDHRDDDGICAVYSASGKWMKEKDYGKTWTAYATEPPCLDRSAWETRENCESCDNCEYAMFDGCEYPCNDCVTECKESYPVPFFKAVGCCKHCGRPLTDAAWEMLERRIRNEE